MKKLLIIFGLLVVLGLRSDAVLTNLIVTGEETISGVITGIYYEVFGSDSGVRVWTNVTGAYIGTNGTYTPDTYVLTRGGLSGYWYHKTSDVLNVLGDYYNSDFGKIVKVAIFLDHYVDNGDGTVSDKTTGLMWAKDANIFGITNWTEAMINCSNLTYGGRSDWRLPSLGVPGGTSELDTLGWLNGVFGGTWEGFDGSPFTNIQTYYYWSSVTHEDFSASAWYLLLDGTTDDRYGRKENLYHAWPICEQIDMSKATDPVPADSTYNVSLLGTNLQWQGCGAETNFTVYFGLIGSMSEVYSGTDTNYATGALEKGKTYTWRIDSQNASASVTGDVWNFNSAFFVTAHKIMGVIDNTRLFGSKQGRRVWGK